ncbi:MAG TPA: biopolymer transporter ExbD [Gemmatimonadaceae bacterium]|nr:biopolymer transporter ExbD [Gemmatimonadaceae bacterium]
MSMSTGGSKIKAEPNVTPMIDVMLVLLIIFMLVVPAINSGFQAIPPQGVNLKPHPEEERDQVLGIDMNGQYFLNKKAIPNAQLGELLKNIYENREEDKILFVKAHKDIEYGKVLDALDIAAHNSVTMTAMITDQQPGSTSLIASDRMMPGMDGKGGKK